MSTNWPAGNIDIRIGDYMFRPHQKWTITPVADAGGYPGSPYFKITIAGTDRALAATADAEVVAVPAFTGSARTTVAHRPVDRWHLPHHAQGGAQFQGTHGSDRGGRQYADAGQVRPQERQGALELQKAVKSTDR